MKILILALLLLLLGCGEEIEKERKHWRSSRTGLPRRVTVYDCQGGVIKTWEGTFKIFLGDTVGTVVSFIGDDGLEKKIIGGITIVEELVETP